MVNSWPPQNGYAVAALENECGSFLDQGQPLDSIDSRSVGFLGSPVKYRTTKLVTDYITFDEITQVNRLFR